MGVDNKEEGPQSQQGLKVKDTSQGDEEEPLDDPDVPDFEHAAVIAKTLKNLSSEKKLEMYALYKQVTKGSCDKPRPALFEVVEMAKWKAWQELGAMSQEDAKKKYVRLVARLSTEQCIADDDDDEKTSFPGGNIDMSHGRTQSQMQYDEEENVKEKDKNILHYACENKVAEVKRLLESKVSVDFTADKADSEHQVLKQTALHLASDHGFEGLAKLLLEKKASVNLQDDDGYTPLHYAVVCERLSLIQLLLEHGADPNIENHDGKTPIDFADDADKEEIHDAFEL
eukprot:jgi/Bigna1/54428/estExt_Genewise1Plus.C_330112